MLRVNLILFILLSSFCPLQAHSGNWIGLSIPENSMLVKRSNLIVQKTKKLQISAGSGADFTFGAYSNSKFLISFDFIPRLSNNLFLDLKIDGIKKGNAFWTLLSFIPEYEILLTKNGKFSIFPGAGIPSFPIPRDIPDWTFLQ